MESIRVGTLRMDNHQVHFLGFFKSMGLLPNILCLVLQTKMVWQKEETELYPTW